MNQETKDWLAEATAGTCMVKYSQVWPCFKAKGHDGDHGPREWKEPHITDARAEHPFQVSLRDDACSMCGEPAAHKVEETSGPANFHPLTNYLCCKHLGAVMGAAHDSYPYGQNFSFGGVGE